MTRSIPTISAFTACSVRGCVDVGEYMLVANPMLPDPTPTYIVTCARHSALTRRYSDLTRTGVQHECEPVLESLSRTLELPASTWDHWWRYFRHMVAKAGVARSICRVVRTCAYTPLK